MTGEVAGGELAGRHGARGRLVVIAASGEQNYRQDAEEPRTPPEALIDAAFGRVRSSSSWRSWLCGVLAVKNFHRADVTTIDHITSRPGSSPLRGAPRSPRSSRISSP